ncbi:MAG TPA: leucine--tRNA ligase, partial [Proteobacteria bacterium]|nr:leucine--tRNA ligase [Pseudomonadota bacterium]
FTGAYCRNPLTGERIPIFVANFVLMEYGTGAIMAVPGHDQRDFEFAKKHDLPIKVVINPPDATLDADTMECAYEGTGTMVNSAEFSGMDSEKGKWAVVDKLESLGLGEKTVSYRLRDWGVSRQRYWGAPIPVIYCDDCGIVPVPDDQLPVVLPHDVKLTGAGGSPLEHVPEFVETTCPRCKSRARRETDTFDTFVESSWYFLRYTCPDFDEGMVDKGRVEFWMPVDLYIGGIEHAVMHLLYARFYTKVMRDLGLIEQDEPFVNLLTQGMVIKDGAKMSKSKGNIVHPDDIIERYGADTARLFILSGAPPQKELEWSDRGVEGSYRFLQRVWRFVQAWKDRIRDAQSELLPPKQQRWEGLYRKAHRTIKKVTADIKERYNFNTAIAALHELANELSKVDPSGEVDDEGRSVVRFALETLVSLLNPFAPHITEELWQRLGKESYLSKEPWLEFDPEWAKEAQLEIAVQVNGKLRSRIWVDPETPKEEIERLALEDANVQKHLQGRAPKRVIHVPNRLINFIV